MWNTTPQERLALGVTALLLAAGIGVRILGPEAGAAAWRNSPSAAETEDVAGVGVLRAQVEERRAADRLRSKPLGERERIDPNTASVDELQRLPRIGPALAARIVAHREANGRFGSLADLDAVSGVGPALLAQIGPLVTLAKEPPSRPGSHARTSGSGAAAPSRRPVAPPSRAAAETPRIAINRATAEELQLLPGIGPAIAARIVEWRSAEGPFRSAEQLERVRGIGPVLRARLAPRLIFDP